MKQILNIVFCVVAMAAITSCGNRSNGNKTSGEVLGNKEKENSGRLSKKSKSGLRRKAAKSSSLSTPLITNTYCPDV